MDLGAWLQPKLCGFESCHLLKKNKGGCASGRSDLVVTQLRRKPHCESESHTALNTKSTTVGLVIFEICRNSSMVERLTYSVRLHDLFMTLLLFLRLLSGRHWFDSNLRHLYSSGRFKSYLRSNKTSEV